MITTFGQVTLHMTGDFAMVTRIRDNCTVLVLLQSNYGRGKRGSKNKERRGEEHCSRCALYLFCGGKSDSEFGRTVGAVERAWRVEGEDWERARAYEQRGEGSMEHVTSPSPGNAKRTNAHEYQTLSQELHLCQINASATSSA